MSRRVLTLAVLGYLALAGVYGFVQLLRGMSPGLSWLGLVLASAPPLAWLLIELKRKPEGPRPPLVISILSGLGLAMAMTLSWRYGDAAGWVHVWAGLALVGWVGYVRWLR